MNKYENLSIFIKWGDRPNDLIRVQLAATSLGDAGSLIVVLVEGQRLTWDPVSMRHDLPEALSRMRPNEGNVAETTARGGRPSRFPGIRLLRLLQHEKPVAKANVDTFGSKIWRYHQSVCRC